MNVIAFINSKGGIVKSTIACNIAVESVAENKKTLLIDLRVKGLILIFMFF
ncbi:MAG: ParA family protein [Planctomycetota bacterium]